MRLVHTIAEVRRAVAAARAGGAAVALVPTMGALHEGHLSLVDRARDEADHVVVSIFVNPLQFGPGEDLAAYPRDLPRDAELAQARGVDTVFAPAPSELYPGGEPVIRVVPTAMADVLCGRYRPGHFEGVLTVVAKLFNIVAPDVAVFGQKDYQQATLVRRMVRDLNVPVRVVLAETVREPDGLALSSRNAYLDEAERRRALGLSRGLVRARDAFRAGERDARRLLRLARAPLDQEAGVRAQYVELVDGDTLEALESARPGAVIAVAAFVGRTRLIDNVILDERG